MLRTVVTAMTEDSAPLWLLIHGLGCAPFTMEPLLAAVPEGHPRHLADLYGSAPELWRPDQPIPAALTTIEAVATALWQQLPSPPPARLVLVAHSWGCRIALEMLRTRPGAIAGIVLLDGSRQVPDALLGQPQQARQAVLERLQGEPPDPCRLRRFLESFVAQCFITGLTPDPIRIQVSAAMGRLPDAWMAASFAAVATWEATALRPALDTLAARRVPLLAIQATGLDGNQQRQPLERLEQSDWIRLLLQRCPEGESWLAPPCGHLLPLEQPDAVVERIQAWWGRCNREPERPGPRP